jgi:hypothetical protein
MSLRDLMQSHAASVFLNTDHFAEAVEHRPGGSSQSETVTAVVTIDPPTVSRERGDARVFTPSIQVLGSVNVNAASVWVIRGDQYGTERIAPVDEAGMRMVELKRNATNQGGKR